MEPTFKRVDDLAEVSERQPTYLAVGVFDGVHRGHQKLLQTMSAAAEADGARSAVLTFFPHPLTIIKGLSGRIYLATLERRVELLAEQGIDLVIVHQFDETLRAMRAAPFVEQLCHHLTLRQLWGGSFSLGYGREGNADFLRRMGRKKGFSVQHRKDLVFWQGERVSSSRVRRALAAGDIAEVTGCLGRPYRVSGDVVQGDQRGRTIGFPTANLSTWSQKVLPAKGVYAATATVGEATYMAATNIGVRPTVADPTLTVEAHLLDFSGDLYGQEVALDFVARIRNEQRFPSLEALTAQITADVAQARRLLTTGG